MPTYAFYDGKILEGMGGTPLLQPAGIFIEFSPFPDTGFYCVSPPPQTGKNLGDIFRISFFFLAKQWVGKEKIDAGWGKENGRRHPSKARENLQENLKEILESLFDGIFCLTSPVVFPHVFAEKQISSTKKSRLGH